MNAIKKYLNKQFSLSMLSLEHNDVSDFYVSCWQTNRSPLPLLCLRTIIFLCCLGMTLACLILMTTQKGFGYFFIYLTDWGLVLITINSGFAVVVSLRAYCKGPIEANFSLPWYVKAYWCMYNSSVPIAFVITLFYWSILQKEQGQTMNMTLDVFIHGVNSVVMFILLLASKHPTNILHVYQPVVVGFMYVLFSVIYYSAGGKDIFGNTWIYPVLDWSKPGIAVGVASVTMLLLIIMYLLVVGLSLCRNALSKMYRKDSMVYSTTNTAP